MSSFITQLRNYNKDLFKRTSHEALKNVHRFVAWSIYFNLLLLKHHESVTITLSGLVGCVVIVLVCFAFVFLDFFVCVALFYFIFYNTDQQEKH